VQKIQHKKGDTFHAASTFLDANGAPKDTTGFTITSQVRTPAGRLVATLTVAITSGVGNFLVSGPTSNWPLGILHWDIQFLQGSEIFSTQTAALELVKRVTQ
jgi:hypothetical protein